MSAHPPCGAPGSSARSRPSRLCAARRTALPVVAVLLALSPLLACAPAGAVTSRAARAALPAIERQVMCVTCKIPLNVAESSQADRERAFIRGLIVQGRTEAQIKSALVAQYGSSVLALPSTKGFDVVAYLVPGAVVLALVALLALLLPSWRRHARAQAKGAAKAPELSAADAARLDADLERFD